MIIGFEPYKKTNRNVTHHEREHGVAREKLHAVVIAVRVRVVHRRQRDVVVEGAAVERLALGTLAQRVPLVEYEGTSGLRAHVRWTCVGHVPSLLRWVHPAATRFTRTLALPTS